MTDIASNPCCINRGPLGYELFENPHCAILRQIRFPKSKRRRVRKKWAKKSSNWMREVDPNVYVVGQRSIVGHPSIIFKLREVQNNGTR